MDNLVLEYELIGILAGVLILVSFLFKNIILNKSIRMAGCLLFIVYGVLISSLSAIFISTGILIIEICTLVMHLTKESEQNKEIERRKKPSINGEFGAIQDLIQRKQIK